MILPIFEHAGRSLNRQRVFRRLVAIHIATVGAVLVLFGHGQDRFLVERLGYTLLIAGIVEGALVLGWRLSQLPKSRSLEPLLLSPVHPPALMLGEQLVGVVQLAFLVASALPLLAGAVAFGWLDGLEVSLLVAIALLWGCFTGLALTWWAYESVIVRTWGERFSLVMVLVYLVVGGLAGEYTSRWLAAIPFGVGEWVIGGFLWFNANNPFALIHELARAQDPTVFDRIIVVHTVVAGVLVLLVLRTAFRLKGHYLDEHYRPRRSAGSSKRGKIGMHPLSWWAVRRVSQYPGRINLWLSIGVSILYASYLTLSDQWPSWLGTRIFQIFEMAGGVAGLTTVLALLASVPAVYQYGLWDSSIPDRCKRLELLLLTKLDASDYLRASWAASWHRGRGYFFAACLLWFAGVAAGRYPLAQAFCAILAGISMVGLSFAVGFRAFARSAGSTTIGFGMSVVLPLVTWGLGANGYVTIARLLPPGMVYFAATRPFHLIAFLASSIFWTGCAFVLLRTTTRTFDPDMRQWYEKSHAAR
ncbi:hypothetical protein Pan216_16720 [Planctomycetes bacterium Pan216]|uniref:Uncharacterized protein n=1 Tax=Kolteria novifilia TaxID=2527975 RepID=A0A518B1F8_9BACT|nr:hypothetical protein Pan216_16720 [Planctomycetes bacterium Pan216]